MKSEQHRLVPNIPVIDVEKLTLEVEITFLLTLCRRFCCLHLRVLFLVLEFDLLFHSFSSQRGKNQKISFFFWRKLKPQNPVLQFNFYGETFKF